MFTRQGKGRHSAPGSPVDAQTKQFIFMWPSLISNAFYLEFLFLDAAVGSRGSANCFLKPLDGLPVSFLMPSLLFRVVVVVVQSLF